MNEPGGPAGAGPAEAALHLAIGHALTGERLEAVVPAGRPDAAGVVTWLAASGWDATRLQAHRALCQHEREPWPHSVPEGLVTAWGQYSSLLAQVRAALDLHGLHQQVRHGPRVLGPAELRLLADKPPHHG
ncbi:hypothetical protein [Aestuariimicrobium sp. Y1814]|uniref:hypothetical protein n=1 Tax=Aestuariimicrobium sp. Y1814 TaxID=3418742 RepID=UPI003DA77D32